MSTASKSNTRGGVDLVLLYIIYIVTKSFLQIYLIPVIVEIQIFSVGTLIVNFIVLNICKDSFKNF